MSSNNSRDSEQQDQKPLTLLEVASSCLAAAFGIQNKANKERDFSRGKPMQFVIVGVVFTVLFLTTVITIVSFITGK